MNTTSVTKTGLRKRPTLEAIVDYLANGQETIKYPDRFAKFIRNHPYLTQLDGEGMMEMQEQQENVWREQVREQRVRELAEAGTQSAPEIRAQLRSLGIQASTSARDQAAQARPSARDQEAQSSTDVRTSEAQTDPEVRTHVRSERGMASTTQRFDLRQQDMDMSDAMDVTVEEKRKREADARQRAEQKRQNILQTIARHNGSDPGVVPFAAAAAAAAASRSRSPPAPPPPPPPAPPAPPARFERSRSPPGSGGASGSGGPAKEPDPSNNTYYAPHVPKVKIVFERSRSPKKDDKKDDMDDKKDIKLETKLKDEKGNIKIRGTAPKMTARPASADDVSMGRVNLNRSRDMNYWKQQSANEIRNQILSRTRDQGTRRQLMKKKKAELLNMVWEMIAERKW
jgi:hypothetical protein